MGEEDLDRFFELFNALSLDPITKEEMVFEDLPEPVGTWCILNNKP